MTLHQPENLMERHIYKDYQIIYVEELDYYAVSLIDGTGGSEGLETLEEAKQFIDSVSTDNP